MNENEPWYAVRCLFYNTENTTYEERTILLKARSHSEAIKKAESEARQYSHPLNGVGYTGFADTFHIFGEKISQGTEVFSLMRTTTLSKDEYIDRFLDSGFERRS